MPSTIAFALGRDSTVLSETSKNSSETSKNRRFRAPLGADVRSPFRGVLRLAFAAFAAVVVASLAGCSDDPEGEKKVESKSYAATVRWTSHGVPHVKADTLADASFGSGYAFATLSVCTMADQLVKVNAKRAYYFGPGAKNVHLESDFFQRFMRVRERAEERWDGLSDDSKAMLEGFAAGYNHYLDEKGPAGLPKRCKDAEWVTKVEPVDVFTYMNDLALVASSRALPLLPLVNIHAKPPKQTAQLDQPFRRVREVARTASLLASGEGLRRASDLGVGSNGWALGKEKSANGKGMVLANPHFPWDGELKFWQLHVTVPGVYDVAGAALYGSPIPNIGTNESLAWTHTVSKSSKFTAYRIEIDPADSKSYLYDGKSRKMESRDETIEVKKDDGTHEKVTRTYYSSHYGPIVAIAGIADWTTKSAFTIRDANANNVALLDQFLAVGKAKTIAELDTVMGTVQANPWVNTIAADSEGNAFYAESNSVPNLTKASYEAHQKAMDGGDSLVSLLFDYGFYLMDGSNSRDEWQVEEGSREPGLVPWSKTPHVTRTDYVANANESYWYLNAKEPLTGFARIFGKENAPRSLRTRITVQMIEEVGASAPSGVDGKFTVEELAAVPHNNRNLSEEHLRPGTLDMCKEVTEVVVSGEAISLVKACEVLAAWDGTVKLGSKGAILWREFAGAYKNSLSEHLLDEVYATPWSDKDILHTPTGLSWKTAKGKLTGAAKNLALAVRRLNKASIPLDATLGEYQYTTKDGEKLAVPGGMQPLGCFNIAQFGERATTIAKEIVQTDVINSATDLTKTGYPVDYGSSFMMALGFDDKGPVAKQIVTYSQSSEHESPWFKDQTKLYGEGKWIDLLYHDADIAADPGYNVVEIKSK